MTSFYVIFGFRRFNYSRKKGVIVFLSKKNYVTLIYKGKIKKVV